MLFAGSSGSSAMIDRNIATAPSSSDTANSELSPLVDVASMCSVMSDLHLGDSVDTTDSSKFLANFSPSDTVDVHSKSS